MKSGERTFGPPPYCFGDWREGLVCDPPVLSEERRLNAIIGDWERSGRGPFERGIGSVVRALAALFDRVIHERAACEMPFRAGQAPFCC